MYHITPRDSVWQVKRAGSEKALKICNTQAEAIEYAKTTAKNQSTSIVIHRPDGSIREVINYKGKK